MDFLGVPPNKQGAAFARATSCCYTLCGLLGVSLVGAVCSESDGATGLIASCLSPQVMELSQALQPEHSTKPRAGTASETSETSFRDVDKGQRHQGCQDTAVGTGES